MICVVEKDLGCYLRQQERGDAKERAIESLTDALWSDTAGEVYDRVQAMAHKTRHTTHAHKALRMLEEAMDEAASVLVDEDRS